MLVCCAGIPPQLSGPSACRTSLLTPHPVVVCFAWCVATSFPPVSAILTIVTCCCPPLYTPAKAATKHNTNTANPNQAIRRHLPIIVFHPPSALPPLFPPCDRSPLPLPPPCTKPPATDAQGLPCQQRLPRAFQNLSLFGAATALPHPGVACPVGLVLLVRSLPWTH